MRKRVAAVVGSIALLLVASLVVAVLFLIYRPLPTIDGEYRLLGLQERGEVLRDSFGVAHIYAKTTHDLFYLQGYVTAQDRLFQMDLYRRAGRGRLSEVLGTATIDADRQMRTFGFGRIAERELALVSEDSRSSLRAYADGVNKFLEQKSELLPLEFLILGYKPEPWTAEDSIIVAKLQVYDAAGNYLQELLRADIAARLGADAIATLMPDPGQRAATSDDATWRAVSSYFTPTASLRGETALRAVLPTAGPGNGSNCWALAGKRTATGSPILVGDTHLAVRNPSIWYEIGLEGPGYRVVGFSFAGIPGIVIGHSDRIAWSFTYAYADTQDLFVERPDPSDPRRFEFRGQFEAATVVHESIAVKGGTPVTLDVTVTRHGPIITPLLEGQSAQLALRWTALEPGRTVDFALGLMRARGWDDFRRVAADFSGAAVSACYADVDGHIGYLLIGQIPLRSGDGRLPLPGWSGEHEWSGTAPASTNPSNFDPETGMIVNANDRPSSATDAPWSAGEWDPGFRAGYLRARLATMDRANLPAMRRLQTDLTSLSVGRGREAILTTTPRTDLGRRAQTLLRTWDGSLAAGSAPAAVYEAWMVHMASRTFKAKLGDPLYARYANDGRALFALYQLLPHADHAWFADDAAGARGRAALGGLALDDAAGALAERMGADPAKWTWGAVHTITFAHPLAVGPLARLLSLGPIARGGDDDSINDAAYDVPKPYAVSAHASQRMIADLGDLDRSLSITPVGQSGQPGAKYWGDQMPLWAAGEYKPMRFSRDKLGRLDGALVFRPR